jgi:hypothetical protein
MPASAHMVASLAFFGGEFEMDSQTFSSQCTNRNLYQWLEYTGAADKPFDQIEPMNRKEFGQGMKIARQIEQIIFNGRTVTADVVPSLCLTGS